MKFLSRIPYRTVLLLAVAAFMIFAWAVLGIRPQTYALIAVSVAVVAMLLTPLLRRMARERRKKSPWRRTED